MISSETREAIIQVIEIIRSGDLSGALRKIEVCFEKGPVALSVGSIIVQGVACFAKDVRIISALDVLNRIPKGEATLSEWRAAKASAEEARLDAYKRYREAIRRENYTHDGADAARLELDATFAIGSALYGNLDTASMAAMEAAAYSVPRHEREIRYHEYEWEEEERIKSALMEWLTHINQVNHSLDFKQECGACDLHAASM